MALEFVGTMTKAQFDRLLGAFSVSRGSVRYILDRLDEVLEFEKPAAVRLEAVKREIAVRWLSAERPRGLAKVRWLAGVVKALWR